MADTEQTEQEVRVAETPPETPSPSERAEAQPAAVERPERKPQGDRPQGERPQGERKPQGQQGQGQGQRREGGGNREGREGREDRGGREGGGREGGRDRGRERDERRGGERGRFEGPPEIDIEKLISDPLYLDNQAHGVVSRMRDMDSGTKSQLRRLYNAVRRAVRAPENERQQQFVMLRARLAYTIARHSLRSLDSLEKLLLQVTRKNDARGYERFRDLFEAIVAYNE